MRRNGPGRVARSRTASWSCARPSRARTAAPRRARGPARRRRSAPRARPGCSAAMLKKRLSSKNDSRRSGLALARLRAAGQQVVDVRLRRAHERAAPSCAGSARPSRPAAAARGWPRRPGGRRAAARGTPGRPPRPARAPSRACSSVCAQRAGQPLHGRRDAARPPRPGGRTRASRCATSAVRSSSSLPSRDRPWSRSCGSGARGCAGASRPRGSARSRSRWSGPSRRNTSRRSSDAALAAPCPRR